MRNIGIYGGTFNPIHIGHMIAAQEVLSKLNLDKIVFMPAGNPPHKTCRDMASQKERYDMVRLAIESNPCFEISDMEIKRQGKTYTYDTLVMLREQYPDVHIVFIIGYDSLTEMDGWKNVEKLFGLCEFVVVTRENTVEEVMNEINDKHTKYGAHIKYVPIPDIEVSSTMIRKRAGKKYSIKYLVNEMVENYIIEKGLYLNDVEL